MLRTPRHNCRTRRDQERGTVLVIVMWISMVLITLALYFGHSMTVEFRASANNTSDAAAAQAAEGVRRYLEYVFNNALTLPGDPPDPQTAPLEQITVGNATVWLVGRNFTTDASETEPTFGLVAENAKLDLNTATADMLSLLPNMPQGLAERIVDWRDEDEDLTEGGAESQDYLLGSPGYYAKNGDFESIEELRFLMRDDWYYFLGEDANGNGVLDPNEDDGDASPPSDNQNGMLDPGIIEYVTIYNREPLSLGDGGERTNVTDGNVGEAIRSILEENLDADRAEEIADTVGNQEYDSVLELYAFSGMTPEEFELVEGYLYQPNPDEDDPEDYIRGLININMASQEVLYCVFEDDAIASALVSYRSSLAPESLTTVAWVVDALQGDQALIQAIGPRITGSCFVYTADLAAVGAHGRGFARVAYVLDVSAGSAEILYRRDRAAMGWPLGEAIRTSSRSDTGEQDLF